MCLGIPGRIVEIGTDHPGMARVDVEGVVRDINLALLDDDPAVPGDWVLIHLGFALEKMTAEDAAEVRAALMVLDDQTDDGDVPGFVHGDDDFSPAGAAEARS